jgi:hypothetical protein
VGKIADWQPFPGTDRFNYQNSYDRLGAQLNNTCDNDPLCSLYYANGGATPKLAGLMPVSGHGCAEFARSVNDGTDNVVTFYVQNRNWGDGPGLVDWDAGGAIDDGAPFVDDTWRRTILRLTLNVNGVMGTGRLEEWMQKAGEPAIKVMEYIGDPGGFDAGLVQGRNASLGGNTWLPDGAILHWYNLSAVAGNFDGGSLVHLGYIRIWSHPRE